MPKARSNTNENANTNSDKNINTNENTNTTALNSSQHQAGPRSHPDTCLRPAQIQIQLKIQIQTKILIPIQMKILITADTSKLVWGFSEETNMRGKILVW